MDLSEARPCERVCVECNRPKHFSKFRSFRSKDLKRIDFSAICRDCEQIKRNEKKNEDRAYAIVKGRAARRAGEAGMSTQFFMVNMNWQCLVEQIRPLLEPNSKCVCCSCGHGFRGERDIHFDHIEKPRAPDDWERHHARNIRILCASCNQSKGDKAFQKWLEDMEQTRLSNELHRAPVDVFADDKQLDLFA